MRDPQNAAPSQDKRAANIVAALQGRSVVLVGMMGSGKTSVGKRLAMRLGLPFADADHEIEVASGMTVPEIFTIHGEAAFRDGERRVVARLLKDGQKILSTGGGAFNNSQTRDKISELGISIWLRAEFDVLMRRVRKRANRPLLQTPNPEATLQRLIDERYPIYALADLTVQSQDGPVELVVEASVRALEHHLGLSRPAVAGNGATPPASAKSATTVRVELDTRAYDIEIGAGLIEEAGARIAKLKPGAACAIVTDENVARHHLPRLQRSLEMAQIRYTAIIVPAGEATKSYAHFAQVCDSIIGAKMERGDLVVALGGGVIGDLAGFAAASVRRGMGMVQIPTSLLAQVDSSVGGKTGINSPHGKNLIGAFHQPSLVLADSDALATLPEREFRAGYAELAKYGLIDNAPFFHWLEANWRAVFAGGNARDEAIATACRAKAAMVLRDEFEHGDRALLNLGHTFGHAFERLTHYNGDVLVHGEGVAVGMACAFRMSVEMGLCSGQDAGRVEGHLRAVGLPTRIGEIPGWNFSEDAIIDAMYQDKKVQRGALTFILARSIGESFIARNVDAEIVRKALVRELAKESSHAS